MSVIDDLLSELRTVCAGLVDKRQGQECRYTMADIGMAGFSVFFMQSPSFLAHQRVLEEGYGGSNCQTLLGMTAIPSDNHIRQMLDGNVPSAFDGLFLQAVERVEAADGLSAFRRLGGRVLIALDGMGAPLPASGRSILAMTSTPVSRLPKPSSRVAVVLF